MRVSQQLVHLDGILSVHFVIVMSIYEWRNIKGATQSHLQGVNQLGNEGPLMVS